MIDNISIIIADELTNIDAKNNTHLYKQCVSGKIHKMIEDSFISDDIKYCFRCYLYTKENIWPTFNEAFASFLEKENFQKIKFYKSFYFGKGYDTYKYSVLLFFLITEKQRYLN